MDIAIIGAGNVGGALGQAWAKGGHTVIYGVPAPTDPKHQGLLAATRAGTLATVADAARAAGVVVLAVPFDAVPDAIAACGDLAGKIVIDATNPLSVGAGGLELALGFDRSGGERTAALAKGAFVFKTLNQVGFEVMADAAGYAAPPVMFVAGDDEAAKQVVLRLVGGLGFQAVDAGGIKLARLLQPFAMLWIHMALNRKTPRDNAFAWLARGRPG